MKRPLLFFMTFFYVFSIFAQQNDVLNAIKDQIEIIDSYMESDVFSLDPEEFLKKAVDHGAELNGYYEHDRLKKIVRKIGLPTAMLTTVFYFWNDQLIYVNYKQSKYLETKNELGQTIMDHDNAVVKYQATYYFDKGKSVKKRITGKPIKNIQPQTEFVNYSLQMKKLLDNKFMNRNVYEMLQGKWKNTLIPGEDLQFQETIRISFREGKFFRKYKVKIKDQIMYCSSPKNRYVFKYKIISLNHTELVLEDLQNPSADLFMYKKEE